ncbi:glutathione-dependent formaldehyde-activating [Tieghemostelium lacteum]|uniref:Glutathione-dependent formaldehyde-activating n=1 Tax=Tieghemostelium lacteum TaxID=361077 RepID=A0A152A1T8_TIELA|nr:glutathione-dependent formaldehyde-activating [Tieghemostelium lacteum]|eukprot:KYR00180.1 glutathione-dependent formaldehyde-activating [Tieghemostelium lacteum]
METNRCEPVESVKSKYTGSCHCKAITYEADIDFKTSQTTKCNCSICQKSRYWEMIVKPDCFRLLTGKETQGDYQWGAKTSHHHFCKTCGVSVYVSGHIPEIGGDFIGILISTIDNLSQKEFSELVPKVHCMNGRDNDWFNVPEHVSHL